MTQKDSFSLITCIKLIGVTTISLLAYFVFSLIADLCSINSEGFSFLIALVWAGATTLISNNQVHALKNEKNRTFVYSIVCIVVYLGCLFINSYTHGLTQNTKHINGIQETLLSEDIYYQLEECPEIDTTHIGIYTSPRISKGKYGTSLSFDTYVVHPFKNASGAYYGFKVSSESHDISFSSDENIRKFQEESMKQRHKLLKAHPIDTHIHFLKRIKPRDTDYRDYKMAHEQCNDVENYAAQKIVILTPMETNVKEKGTNTLIIFLIIYLIVFIPLMGVIFKFADTSPNIQNKLEKEEADMNNSLFAFAKNKDNWWTIAIGTTIILYYFIVSILGFNEMHVNNMMLHEFGGASYFAVIVNGEIWRLLTATFMHIGIHHLSGNLIAYCLVAFFLTEAFPSWRFAVIFFVSGIISNLCVCLISPHNILVGASGAIMGLYGAFISIFIMQLIINKINNRGTYNKKVSDSILPILIVFVLIPTILVSFQRQVSMSAHIIGLVLGMIIGLIILLIEKRGDIKQTENKAAKTNIKKRKKRKKRMVKR